MRIPFNEEKIIFLANLCKTEIQSPPGMIDQNLRNPQSTEPILP